MTLSRRLLIPIMLVSYFAVALCGIVYYQVMQRQVYSIYHNDIASTLSRLEDEMRLTNSVNDAVIERVDHKNLALARSIAEFVRQNPTYFFTSEALQELAGNMEVNLICIIDKEGIIVASSNPGYLNRTIMEQAENSYLMDNMGVPGYSAVQEPVVNSAGDWIQYYIVPRTDETGYILAGVEYSVSTIIQETFTDGVNAGITTIGDTGHIAILHGSVYAAHPDEDKVGQDVGKTEWYSQMISTDSNIQLLDIDGDTYLVGHMYFDEDTLLLALLPYEEYHAPLENMSRFTFLLVCVSSAIIIIILFFLIRRNVIRPLLTLSSTVNRVAKGDLSVSVEGSYIGEMEQLRQDINKTISQLRSRQDHVLKNFPGVIWSCDTNYICTVSSGQAMERLGFDPQDFLGHHMLEAIREHADEEVAVLIERTFVEGRSLRLNQERMGRYLSITTSLMYDDGGAVSGMVGVCADVTDLHQLQQELIATTAEAERASRAKSDFLSRMSHEIRTPMNAIIGMNTIAQKSTDPSKIQYCLDKIQAASDQLLTLINDILDMSKIEANKFELSESEFDFERMLQNISNVVDVRAAEKKQNFIIDFTDIFDRNVVGDELRLSQVLINLLNNAVKFTPEGGRVTLKIRHEDVDSTFARFHFDIIDNGIGISQEQQQRLFTSFEQADGSITRRFGGTGLGLAICKNIVQMMNGQIQLKSTLGKGSCFSFTVNLNWGNAKGTRDLIHKLPLGDHRILVIDDSEDVCLYFENILDSYQLSCDTALSGADGINKVNASLTDGKPYNLIFVDWMMPGMNGIETARHIKTIAPPDTIVIMISVADWSEIEREAKQIGVDKFLAKPVLPTVLFQSIVEWLNNAEVEKAASREPDTADYGGKTMLLAEDIDINREIIISMLEGTGIQVDCAENGAEAVQKYTTAPNRYDLILMDIQMPEMDGYEATRQIRRSGKEGCSSIPIIAMTANAFKSDVEQCLEAGMNDHIAKPVNFDDLYDKLHTALSRQDTL